MTEPELTISEVADFLRKEAITRMHYAHAAIRRENESIRIAEAMKSIADALDNIKLDNPDGHI